jgi:hypothetical protein
MMFGRLFFSFSFFKKFKIKFLNIDFTLLGSSFSRSIFLSPPHLFFFGRFQRESSTLLLFNGCDSLPQSFQWDWLSKTSSYRHLIGSNIPHQTFFFLILFYLQPIRLFYPQMTKAHRTLRHRVFQEQLLFLNFRDWFNSLSRCVCVMSWFIWSPHEPGPWYDESSCFDDR